MMLDGFLHTSKRMHFIEDTANTLRKFVVESACIRQNVCTSLRISPTSA